MSGFGLVVIMSTLANGQVQSDSWGQWGQYQPYNAWDSWDWRRDPFHQPPIRFLPPPPPARASSQRFMPPFRPMPSSMPSRGAPGKFYGPGLVRLDLNNLAADSPTMQSFRKAVDAMKKLPADDPHNWNFQANIHGFPSGTPNPDSTWGQCQHGNWWFLPWHRAYLYHFEKICRRYAADPTFALPYWDYSAEKGRALPAAFRDTASPLYDSTRRADVNSGTDLLTPAVVVDGLATTMTLTVFSDFGQVATFGGRAMNAPQHRGNPHGALEAIPHDVVHQFVGGNMASGDTAGRDPIFLCHHANVDRLWILWLQQGGGRANPSNDVWLKQEFTFYDENKQKVTMTMGQAADLASLGYSYEKTAPPPPTPPTPAPQTVVETVARVDTANVALQGQPVTLSVVLPNRSWARKRKGAQAGPATIQLQLDDVRFAGLPDSTVAVYVNLPQGSPIPSPRSPNFAGYFTFFGDHHHEGFVSQVDVSRHLLHYWRIGPEQPTAFTVTLVRTAPGTRPRDFREPIRFRQLSVSATK